MRCLWLSLEQVSPVTDWVLGGTRMRDDSAEILFQSLTQKAVCVCVCVCVLSLIHI